MLPHYLLLLLSKDETKSLVKSDIEELNKRNSNTFSFFYYILFNPSFRALFYHRLGKLSFFIKWYLPGEKNCLIGSHVEIGRSAYFAHAFATVINAKSIGYGFACRQLTTIGNKIDGRNDLIPTIGNNVTIGANVTIIGNIKIGDNCIIGAGAVVTKDIPDGSIVVGNPCRILSQSCRNAIDTYDH